MDLKEFIDEGARLKSEIQEHQTRLREINKILADSLEFNGKKSTKAEGYSFVANVSLKESISWDQEALNQSRAKLGDEEFFKLFKWEFKPRAKKELDGFLNHNPNAEAIRQAMTIKPGAPSVTYKEA